MGGQAPTDTYKCICTYPNGFKFVSMGTVVGHNARGKGQRVGNTLMSRWRKIMMSKGFDDFSDSRVELLGGDFEVSFRVSVKHPNRKALEPLVRECATASVSMAQGGMVMPGKVDNVVSAFMLLKKKSEVPCYVDVGNGPVKCEVVTNGGFVESASKKVVAVEAASPSGATVKTKLRHLCFARSGDKADAANIGLIARKPEYLPVLRHQVTTERVRMFFNQI